MDSSTPPARELGPLQQGLLQWFAAHGRDLPWRKTRDPYHILVSEIMLQQTQVDRVLPKYLAFLALFPTTQSLAAASTADVIRSWAGLGYNRRAVNLQRAAQAVVEQHGGVFPRDVATLLKLPGVGPYTAGAVACFAFEQDVAFMDTNIRRVIQRAFVGPEEQGPASDAELLAVAAHVLPAGHGWAWNQGVMEIGALICGAASPQCWRCPLQPGCRAYHVRSARDTAAFELAPAAPPRRARAVAERREAPFVGSTRYYRGRIVDALRAAPPGHRVASAALGPQIKPDFTDADRPWLRGLLDRLAADGLVVLDGEHVQLPA